MQNISDEKIKEMMSKEHFLNPQEKETLKQSILKTFDVGIACSALLNLRELFTSGEQTSLLKSAVATNDAYMAYHLHRNYCHELARNPDIRENFRRTVIWTQDPMAAFFLLQRQEDNLESYEDDLKSLEFTNDDLKRFKQVIISSRNPEWAYNLLTTQKSKEHAEEISDDDMWGFDDLDPYAVQIAIELTENERTILKRTIIESRDLNCLQKTFSNVDGLTDGERMVLKGIMAQTQNPDFACYFLCDTKLISYFNEKERANLKQFAVQTKSKYCAAEALKYIFDLAPDERSSLEKIAKTG